MFALSAWSEAEKFSDVFPAQRPHAGWTAAILQNLLEDANYVKFGVWSRAVVFFNNLSPHTPSVYHCHSTHICIWVWPGGGPHGYFKQQTGRSVNWRKDRWYDSL